jgi:peptide/nickel transport system ATP-binding protein
VQIIRGMQKRAGTALLFITHDLRLASHICDDICVLYAGDIVERGPAHDVIRAPRHPYTHALRLANPPVEGTRRRLVTLPEQMPGLGQFAAIKGCRFAPRCPVRADSCAEAVPPLREIVPDHAVRCTSPAAMLGKMSRPDEEAPSPRDSVAGAPALLQLGNLSKVYPGETTWRGRRKPDVVAVRRADLHVQAGEFVGVVGESGSGKSSLARLVMGLEAPTTGTITLDGHDVTARNTAIRLLRLERLQMIFQDPQSALNPRRTVARLITQAMEAPMHRAAAAARHDRACGLLEETGLGTDLLDRYPAQLSGGQKQRVNIARALCITPRLLVADEIVSGLDVSVQAQILNLLLDLRAKRDISLLFISHDLAVVRYLCSRVIVMHQGEIVEAGPVADVFDRPQHSYTRSLLAAVPPDDPTVPWPVAAGA